MDRRHFLLAGAASAAGAADFIRAHAAEAGPGARARVDPAANGSQALRMHEGHGTIEVKFYFEPERPARPALFLQYDIPPGASEGVHTHGPDRAEGAWDEFYYIASGTGRMNIDGTERPVAPGDSIHTPLGVAHGIENTSRDDRLRVFLVAISRGGGG
jgi:mannose-6-phosphate isomerase-like protein (cupin superfamily)